jgi:hypothetical protein
MEEDGDNKTLNSSRRASLYNASALLTIEDVNRRPIIYILFEQSFALSHGMFSEAAGKKRHF